MDRHSIIPLEKLFSLKPFARIKEFQDINGVKVKITSQRHTVFQKSQTCCSCGLTASFLAIERNITDSNYHINMYGKTPNGKDVLFTKDHIIPKSKGGRNNISNYTTMCTICNSKKGNKLPNE